jgi:hypothetical protein
MSALKHPGKLLIVMALPQESRGRLEAAGADLLYTGVGKVNAASTLARRLAEIRCAGLALPLVVNLGTAGSRRVLARHAPKMNEKRLVHAFNPLDCFDATWARANETRMSR